MVYYRSGKYCASGRSGWIQMGGKQIAASFATGQPVKIFEKKLKFGMIIRECICEFQ
jgi:hypothetical protein